MSSSTPARPLPDQRPSQSTASRQATSSGASGSRGPSAGRARESSGRRRGLTADGGIRMQRCHVHDRWLCPLRARSEASAAPRRSVRGAQPRWRRGVPRAAGAAHRWVDGAAGRHQRRADRWRERSRAAEAAWCPAGACRGRRVPDRCDPSAPGAGRQARASCRPCPRVVGAPAESFAWGARSDGGLPSCDPSDRPDDDASRWSCCTAASRCPAHVAVMPAAAV